MGMLDNHNVDAVFGRFEPQPKLLPDGGKEIREAFAGGVRKACDGRTLKLVRRPCEREIESRCRSGLVDHGPVEHGRL